MKENKFYKIIRNIAVFIFKIIYKPTIINKEAIPSNGKMLLVGNHIYAIDCILLMATTKRQIFFIGKKELLKFPFGFLLPKIGMIPVDRKNKNNHEALNVARETLNKEQLIQIFPEGKVNKTNELLPFKMGTVKMAYDTNCDILPFTITGKYKPFRKGPKIVFDKPYKLTSSDLEKENKILKEKIENLITKNK